MGVLFRGQCLDDETHALNQYLQSAAPVVAETGGQTYALIATGGTVATGSFTANWTGLPTGAQAVTLQLETCPDPMLDNIDVITLSWLVVAVMATAWAGRKLQEQFA